MVKTRESKTQIIEEVTKCAILSYIIIIIIISFMQGTYTHIPETHYVPREYGVAAILLFLFMVLISLLSVLNLLYFYISTLRIMCAVPNMAVYYYYYYYVRVVALEILLFIFKQASAIKSVQLLSL